METAGLKHARTRADGPGMSTASRPFDQLPGPVKRLLFGACALTLFIGVSSVIRPEKSLANARYEVAARRAAATGPQPGATPATPATGRPLLGRLEGSPFHIWIYAGPRGPLYTVMDAQGKLLAQEVTGEELYALVPEVAVDQLHMQPAEGSVGPLMMVDPEKSR